MRTIIISQWVLRIAMLLALVLGILFWVGIAGSFKTIHIILGLIVVLALWVIGLAQGFRGGSLALAFASFVVGLLLAIVGLYQTGWLIGSAHWVIQVIHLLLGLSAIGLGEMIAGRAKRQASKTDALLPNSR